MESYEISVPFVNKLTKRFSNVRASIRAGILARYEGPEGDSWLKRNLPGWYYKVTVPDQTFKRKVAQSRAAEDALATQELREVTESAEVSPKPKPLDALKEISDDFGQHIIGIQGSMKEHVAYLGGRLREVKLMLDGLKVQISHNSG